MHDLNHFVVALAVRSRETLKKLNICPSLKDYKACNRVLSRKAHHTSPNQLQRTSLSLLKKHIMLPPTRLTIGRVCSAKFTIHFPSHIICCIQLNKSVLVLSVQSSFLCMFTVCHTWLVTSCQHRSLLFNINKGRIYGVHSQQLSCLQIAQLNPWILGSPNYFLAASTNETQKI